jgi:hypothetical protein
MDQGLSVPRVIFFRPSSCRPFPQFTLATSEGQDDFTPDVPPRHQTFVASLLVACMIGSVVTIVVVLRTLRYFGRTALGNGDYGHR